MAAVHVPAAGMKVLHGFRIGAGERERTLQRRVRPGERGGGHLPAAQPGEECGPLPVHLILRGTVPGHINMIPARACPGAEEKCDDS